MATGDLNDDGHLDVASPAAASEVVYGPGSKPTAQAAKTQGQGPEESSAVLEPAPSEP